MQSTAARCSPLQPTATFATYQQSIHLIHRQLRQQFTRLHSSPKCHTQVVNQAKSMSTTRDYTHEIRCNSTFAASFLSLHPDTHIRHCARLATFDFYSLSFSIHTHCNPPHHLLVEYKQLSTELSTNTRMFAMGHSTAIAACFVWFKSLLCLSLQQVFSMRSSASETKFIYYFVIYLRTEYIYQRKPQSMLHRARNCMK